MHINLYINIKKLININIFIIVCNTVYFKRKLCLRKKNGRKSKNCFCIRFITLHILGNCPIFEGEGVVVFFFYWGPISIYRCREGW